MTRLLALAAFVVDVALVLAVNALWPVTDGALLCTGSGAIVAAGLLIPMGVVE